MTDVGEDDAVVGGLEVVVFEVGGEEDVGAGGDSVVDEEAAGAAAEGDALHERPAERRGADDRQVEAGFDQLEELGVWRRAM